MNDSENLEKIIIPESEIDISYTFSSGPGGQNVNKRETKAILRFKVKNSSIFNDEEKTKILETLANRINKEGVLIIESQKERSQLRNKEIAFEKLNKLVEGALVNEEERIPTKPTKASKEKRINSKKKTGQKKAFRQKPDVEYWE